MDRTTLMRWLEEHPQSIGGTAAQLVEHCEKEVKRHIAEDAWLAARAWVERREHQWEQEWGFPWASQAHVAREICRKLARELKQHEPHPRPGDEEHLLGRELLKSLDPDARRIVSAWALELADEEEHELWQEIVRFTRDHGRRLDRAGNLSHDTSRESGNYASKAAGIAHMLVDEYESHAHPRTRAPKA